MVTKSTYKKALVRFYREEKVIGAGFYVANGYVLTCAHIVTQALGLGKSGQLALAAVAGKSLTLDSPFVAPGQTQTAEVVPSLWRLAEADLAVLKVRGAIPDQVTCLPAQNWRRDWNDNDAGYGTYESCGFPDGHSGGGWTKGVFVDEQADGWIQLEANKAQGFAIEPGFSGAPVWDREQQAIAGMILARDKQREDARIGFMLPYALLKRALEAVELFELLEVAGAEEIPWQSAYQMVRPENYLGSCATTLEAAVLQILDMPSSNSPYLPIVKFIGHLALPELGLAVQPRLICWLSQRGRDVTALLATIKQRIQAQQPIAQQPVAQSPHLLFWVQAGSNSDRYEVQAYLVRDREQYDPKMAKQLQAPTDWLGQLGRQRAERSELEAILRGCLEESVAELADGTGLPDLQIHVFLPLACFHWPVDRWDADELDEFNPAPESVGSRYRLVVRSAERISDPKFCTPQLRALWQGKWSALTDPTRSPCPRLIVADGENLETLSPKLRQREVVGFYRTRVLQVHIPDESNLFSTLCRSGAPVAVSLRQDLPDHCRDDFLQFLGDNLVELPSRMQRIRQQLEGCPIDEHLQQHAALIWEDPKLVPPHPSALNPGQNQRLKWA